MSRDDIGFEDGRPIAIGQEATDNVNAIVDDPRSIPVLIVARRGNDLGVRAYGRPSVEVADILDHIARTYRQAVDAAGRVES